MISEIVHRLLHRRPNTNKYDFGHILILGGAPGMVGAPLLAGEAALRTGAGLVTIASSAEVTGKLEKRVKEIMTLALPESQNVEVIADRLWSFIREHHVTVVIIGPGLAASSADLVRTFLARLHVPVILDAGGLTAFHGHLSVLRGIASKNPAVVITPHVGEYERLTNTLLPQHIHATSIATDFARRHGVTLVLKGHKTLVAQPDGSSYENTTGGPGLATAGTGDVLAGVIAGLIAQGVTPSGAVVAGVYLHGLAGDLASAAKTEPGVIASDIITALPEALKKADKSN
ncbi:MAG TPA: NAD(P)H-hydrate dehydratase [Magnetospirillaceae bacterium]|nr:NAD(P)H-hydrate dehydratase [Magnetospirillaceae bacterium]